MHMLNIRPPLVSEDLAIAAALGDVHQAHWDEIWDKNSGQSVHRIASTGWASEFQEQQQQHGPQALNAPNGWADEYAASLPTSQVWASEFQATENLKRE